MTPRTTALLTWSMWLLSLALTAVSLLLALNLYREGYVFDGWARYTAIVLGFSTVGAVLASHRPKNPIGWIMCAIGLLGGLQHFSAQYVTYALLARPDSLLGGEAMAWVRCWLWVPYDGLFLYLGLLFPDGQLPSDRWRWFARLTAVVLGFSTIAEALLPGPVHGLGGLVRNPLGLQAAAGVIEGDQFGRILYVAGFGLSLGVIISLFGRLRRARGTKRQQIKWCVYAGAIVSGGYVFKYVLTAALPEETLGAPWAAWMLWVGSVLLMAGLVLWPVAMGIAILTYRLYDIDIIINRTLVYGALTGSIIGLYILIVATVGAPFQSRVDLVVSLVATGVVAMLFAPLHEQLQRGVNRLMYGERDDPYAVLSRLGKRLEATIAPKAALETIVETIAQALKAPYVAIKVRQEGDEFTTTAEHGSPKAEPILLPLVYQRENVGQLLVAPRAPGETFSAEDRRLLEDLARQVEVAVHAVRLTADLQRSRERLVTTREEERRRLRRDLHDGLGPTLGYLTLGLDTARRLFAQDPKSAEALLLELRAKTQEAVSDVRRLVYDLRPPALDDLGLVPAIRQQAANHGLLLNEDVPMSSTVPRPASGKSGIVFSVEVTEDLPSLPAAVEVACYRIAQEAIANASRHSGAHSCRVRLSLDDYEQVLMLEVTDDGMGMPQDRTAGVGMSSMRERAEELGGTLSVEALSQDEGGTRVLARFPLAQRGQEE